jgi:hypothetical protein
MFVSDSKNNRILGFESSAFVASLVIGQPWFDTNAPGTTASTFSFVTGIDFDKEDGVYAVSGIGTLYRLHG